MRRKHQEIDETYFSAEFGEEFQVDVDGSIADKVKDYNADLEFDEIVKRLMSNLSSFLGMDNESRAAEMKTILWNVYLINYDEDDFVKSNHYTL